MGRSGRQPWKGERPMKALTSSDIKLWAEHQANAQKCFDDVAKAVDEANAAIETFNAVVQEACQLATTWADAAEEYYQERSERWQEDEAGQHMKPGAPSCGIWRSGSNSSTKSRRRMSLTGCRRTCRSSPDQLAPDLAAGCGRAVAAGLGEVAEGAGAQAVSLPSSPAAGSPPRTRTSWARCLASGLSAGASAAHQVRIGRVVVHPRAPRVVVITDRRRLRWS